MLTDRRVQNHSRHPALSPRSYMHGFQAAYRDMSSRAEVSETVQAVGRVHGHSSWPALRPRSQVHSGNWCEETAMPCKLRPVRQRDQGSGVSQKLHAESRGPDEPGSRLQLDHAGEPVKGPCANHRPGSQLQLKFHGPGEPNGSRFEISAARGSRSARGSRPAACGCRPTARGSPRARD